MGSALAPGTILNGRFEIKRVISEGPIGAVYLVVDIKITDRVWTATEYLPLPIPRQERAGLEEVFYEQVEFVKTLRHPNLVQLLSAFTESNRNYLVSEYINGLSLEAIAELTQSPLSETEVLGWAVQVCEALEYLHSLSKPFYMKDLSPRHIIVDSEGHVKIGGYGLHLLFTPPKYIPHSFLAPEFRETGKTSAAGDIYSFAATLYYLLSRKFPSEESLLPLRTYNTAISQEASDEITSCLNRDPGKRPLDLLRLQRKFHDIITPKVIPPVPPPSLQTYLSRLADKAKIHLAHGITTFISLTMEFIHRPYYLVLVGLLVWSIVYTKHFGPSSHFQKKEALLYAVTSQEVIVVSEDSFKIVDEIKSIVDGYLAIFLPNEQAVWVISQEGKVTEIDPQNDSLAGNFSISQQPGGIAPGASSLVYLSMTNDNTVTAVTSTTGLPIAVFPVGKHPRDLLYLSKRNELYVANSEARSISILDSAKYTQIKRLDLDASPSHLVKGFDESYVYVTYDQFHSVEVLDPQTSERITTLDLNAQGPYELAESRNEIAVTAKQGNQVMIFERSSWSPKAQFFLEKPGKVLFSPDGNSLFVLNEAGYLYRMDARTGSIVQQVKLGRSANLLVYVP